MIFDNRINKKRHDKNELSIEILKILILNNKYQIVYNQDLIVQSIC